MTVEDSDNGEQGIQPLSRVFRLLNECESTHEALPLHLGFCDIHGGGVAVVRVIGDVGPLSLFALGKRSPYDFVSALRACSLAVAHSKNVAALAHLRELHRR